MNVAPRRAVAALVALALLAPSAAVMAEDGNSPAPAAGNAAQESPPASVKPPVDMDGVLLDDGRQIEGTYDERANQRWVIQPKGGGQPLNVSAAQIVIAEKGGEVELRGEESAAGEVWRAAVRAEYCDALEGVVKDCAEALLVDRARAVMKRMTDNGASEARLAKLGASLDGKTQRADPAAEAKMTASEDAAKAAQIALLERGVAWCTKRGFPTAATAMLNEVGRLDPKRSADVAARTKALMPASFFFKDATDAVAQWRKWAEALLPSSAQFVDRGDEDVWSRLENKPWTDGATLCFRTCNVLLFIRDTDPAVCGKALRMAEQTVRALQVFLNEGEPDVVTGDSSRLEIRIHKSRADYLAEEPARGKKADVWSAGFYSPMENVSHFYVDRRKDGAADVEELTRVLTHEFTHHYMTSRWVTRIITARGATAIPGGPGFWVVEGMAEFVQNQSHHMEERGPRFDDDNVHGNDVTAQARKARFKSRLLGMETFIDMKQGDFQTLSDDPLGVVKLRRSPGVQGCSERSLWYDQAGALTYFFLQKKGPEMRRKFVRYVSDHYAGNSHVPAWTWFGYESAQALDNDFLAFLKTVGG
jgi:hypothetical protein